MYLAFKDIDINILFIELKKTNYILAVIGSLIGVLVGSYIRAIRWKYLLAPIKKDTKINELFSAVMVGYMVNAITPRGGEISRPLLIAKKENISRGFCIGTILVERIFDVISMLIAFGFSLFIYREDISTAFGEFNIEKVAFYASIAILIAVIIIVIMILNIERTEIIVENISKKIFPKKIQEKIHKLFISLLNGFLFIKHPKNYFIIFSLSVLTWLSYVLSTYVTLHAFHINLNFIAANLVLTMMTFAQTLPLPGNSAGTYHLFAKTALVAVFGIESELAIGFATVNHLLGLIFLILIGLYFSIKENYTLTIKNTNQK